ncbi:MAG: NmrA family NAD(P)-binding protein [Chloroflexota bacterium]
MSSNSDGKRILVIGGTGNSGGSAVEALRAFGAQNVRIGARDTAKAEARFGDRVEVVHFDWEKPETYASTLDGVQTCAIVMPVIPDIVTPGKAFLDAAAQSGSVKHVIKMSGMLCGPESPLPIGQDHEVLDQYVKTLDGVAWTSIRPTLFMTNMLIYQLGAIEDTGAFYGAPEEDGKVKSAYVSVKDLGEVMAKVAIEGEKHYGQSYELTGPKALLDSEVAELLSGHLGKPVGYVGVPDEPYRQSLVDNPYIPEFMVGNLGGAENAKTIGLTATVTGDVQRVLGREPESFAQYLNRIRANK